MATVGTSTVNTTLEPSGDADPWTAVSSVLGVVLLCFLIAGALYCYHVRYGLPSWLLCCDNSIKRDGIEMGYLPANITVNEAAVAQGVPDIFLRDSNHSGRISVEPSSFEITQDMGSGAETSGTWAEYLRTTLSMRRTASATYRSNSAEGQGSNAPASSPVQGAGQTIENGAALTADVQEIH